MLLVATAGGAPAQVADAPATPISSSIFGDESPDESLRSTMGPMRRPTPNIVPDDEEGALFTDDYAEQCSPPALDLHHRRSTLRTG